MPISEGRHRKIAPRHQDTLLSSASVISILIVSFNTAPELVACLESLARCAAALPHEIIVVDNGSTDGSVQAVRTRVPLRTRGSPGSSPVAPLETACVPPGPSPRLSHCRPR